MQKKSLKPWILLLLLPIVVLTIVSLVQFVTRFLFAGADNALVDTLKGIINIVSLIVGVVSVVSIMLTPLWIILLILAANHNKRVDHAASPGQPPLQKQ